MKRLYKITILSEIDSKTIEEGKKLAKNEIEEKGLKVFEVEKSEKQRTLTQNRSLHLWFKLIADEARRNGQTMDMLIKKPNELIITESLLKDLFRLIGKTMFKKDSTAKLTSFELNTVVETFEKTVAERLGISIAFPSLESLLEAQNQI